MKFRNALAQLLLLPIILTALPIVPGTVFTATGQTPSEAESDTTGLQFRLSEVPSPSGTPAPVPVKPEARPARAKRLSESATEKLLSRLPALTPEPGDIQAFRLHDGVFPPPPIGQVLQAAFAAAPAASGPPPVVESFAAPLEVLRYAPEGEVKIAPALSITFSLPMVEVSSQAETAAIVPVTVSPQPPGRWRWLGTQTLVFEPDFEGGRFPMATDYTVTIPAGIRSATGKALATTKTFTFSTPPPSVKTSYPTGSDQARDPVMFMQFDQRIDAARLVERLRLLPASAAVRLRPATAEEIAADESVRDLVKQAPEGRWIAFRAIDAAGGTKNVLPADTTITVAPLDGTVSAEGPRIVTTESGLTFKTYAQLSVTNAGCRSTDCSPFEQLAVTFNNSLDEDSFSPALISITPAIPEAKVTLGYNAINIEGVKKAGTRYTVTIDPALKDRRGQTLSGKNRFDFDVKTSPPQLFSTNERFMVLDPALRPTFNVYSINYPHLRVKLFKVQPEDWDTYRKYQESFRPPHRTELKPPGRLVFEREIAIAGRPEELTETAIDLAPALTGGRGQVFVRVEPIEAPDAPVTVYAYRAHGRVESWVQATDIGLDAFADNGGLTVWANSLTDGKPLTGVEVTVAPGRWNAITDSGGLATMPFDPATRSKELGVAALLIARRGGDVAIFPESYDRRYTYDPGRWSRDDPREKLSWFVFDDRKLYRPGEEVSVKGWVRRVELNPRGDIGLPETAGERVEYVLKDESYDEIAEGSTTLNALGGFDLKLQLPVGMALGRAWLEFKLSRNGGEFDHRFQVQEFRRPEFELTPEWSPGLNFVGSSATATVNAAYFAGGGLANADVEWEVRSWPVNFTPPNRDDFTFGQFRPWWLDERYPDSNENELSGKTDAHGRHTIRMNFESVSPARPSVVRATATVQDVNRQSLTTAIEYLVSPASLYVGIKSTRTFIQAGQDFALSAIVTDVDGQAVAGREIKLRLARHEWTRQNGEWIEREVDAQEQTVKSGTEAVPVRFTAATGGSYELTAQVRDERERLNETELPLWVAGAGSSGRSEMGSEKVELIPDRRTYAPGDTAEILVRSPFGPAEGVVTLRRSGVLSSEHFTMTDGAYTLRVPLDEAMTPNVHVQVDLVGNQNRVDDQGNTRSDLPTQTAFASGELDLSIPPTNRRLKVTATPRDAVLEPGQETTVDVQVLDTKGKGVAGTDTAVVVVDEAVLALTGYRLGDPLPSLYPAREANVTDYHLRRQVKLGDVVETERLARGRTGAPTAEGVVDQFPVDGGRYTKLAQLAQSISYLGSGIDTTGNTSGTNVSTEYGFGLDVRKNFNALAVFAASVSTDADGRAQVRVKLPDNLTRYRVIAYSVAGGTLAGAGESTITARKDLMGRPSAPRFLNFGDRAELPVVVQNDTAKPMTVDIAVRATNAELTDGAGRTVTIPAHDRAEVRFPIATRAAGVARFQIVTAAGKLTDAAEISLPVYTPATTEAAATYGTIDQGAIAQPVKAPGGAIRAYGGLEVTTASTQLQELTDAVIYLVRYPYECSEQISSRMMALAALKDVLTAFNSKDLPIPEAMRASVDNDIKRLEGLQNDDGGFDFWKRGEPSVPFVSVHVAHALVIAQAKGFAVSPTMVQAAKDYLGKIATKIPKQYSPESRRAIQAYALYVRYLMHDPDPVAAEHLIAEAGGETNLSLESLGWILPILSGNATSAPHAAEIRRLINNRVTETAGAAHFADSYSDGAYTILSSDRRTDGVLLNALILDQPQSDLLPKLVRGLLGGRKAGRWMNTQENVFVLLALDRYFNTYEKAEPNFTARIWLGKSFAGEQNFAGRSVDKRQLNVPMSELADRTASEPTNLTIDKQGPGRLYYRIGTRYAPAGLNLAAANYGFRVERNYEAVDDPADVRRDADGTWHIKAGARVRVRVLMSSPASRYHVALVDPLPAGLEAINPELAGTQTAPDDDAAEQEGDPSNESWRGDTDWFDHQNLRDDRAEAFTAWLLEGEYVYSYLARATTLGLFIVPPPKAEEMYAPETFGRGQTDRVKIE